MAWKVLLAPEAEAQAAREQQPAVLPVESAECHYSSSRGASLPLQYMMLQRWLVVRLAPQTDSCQRFCRYTLLLLSCGIKGERLTAW